MTSFMGNIEVACISAITQAEAIGGRTMTEQERKLFKAGFLAGFNHGIEVAKTIVTGSESKAA